MNLRLFQARLRQAVDWAGLTWPELARRSGYSASYIQNLINGKKCNPTVACVCALAATLDRPLPWLLGIDDD